MRDPNQQSTVPLWLATVSTAAGLGLSIWMALESTGVHHDDDLTHFQMAAWSREHPAYLLNHWGRPGFTLLFAVPSQFGWMFARIFSGIVTAATAWLAFDIGRRFGLRAAALIPAFLWLQPMTFTLSYTTLTEPVLALYLTLGFWLYQRDRVVAGSAIVSLCALTRHEAAIFLPLWAIALSAGDSVASWRRRLAAILTLAWAPIAHNALALVFLREAPILDYFRPTPTDEYGQGSWLTMFAELLISAGGGITVLAIAGAWLVWRRPRGALWIACGATYLLTHTVCYRFGLFASGGYYRFLVPLGPVLAVCAAAITSHGLHAMHTVARSGRRRTIAPVRFSATAIAAGTAFCWFAAAHEAPPWMSWALAWVRFASIALLTACIAAAAFVASQIRGVRAAAAMIPAALLVGAAIWQPFLSRGVQPPYRMCAPLTESEEVTLIREACEWIRSAGLAERHIVSTNVWVNHFLGIIRTPFDPRPAEAFSRMSPGDLFIWDRRESESPRHGIRLAELTRRRDFVELWHGRPHRYEGVYCYVFEKRSAVDDASAATLDPASPEATRK